MATLPVVWGPGLPLVRRQRAQSLLNASWDPAAGRWGTLACSLIQPTRFGATSALEGGGLGVRSLWNSQFPGCKSERPVNMSFVPRGR